MTETIKLLGCTVAGVRADMVNGRVKITFDTHLDAQMMEARRTLAILAMDNSPVDLEITEQQLRLPFGVSSPPTEAVTIEGIERAADMMDGAPPGGTAA